MSWRPVVVLLGLLLASTTICYVDRQALSVAAPVLREQFGMSNFAYSEVLFGFLLSYAVFSPVMGHVIDRIGTRVGLSAAVIVWSIASMLQATARGTLSLGIFRFLLGAGEAGNFPASVKMISQRIAPEYRTMATGVFNVGAGLGAILAPPLVVWLILNWGWQSAFVTVGGLGFVWVYAWLTCHRLKWIPAPLTVESSTLTGPGDDALLRWQNLLRYRQTWALMIARFIADPTWYFYLFWLPEYLHSVRGFDLQHIGYFAWVPFLSADLGSVAGGALGAILMREGWSLDRARKVTLGVCAACMPLTIAAGYCESAAATIGIVSLATFAHQAWTANLISLPADLFPPRVVAFVYGISALASSVGGMLFMLLVGWAADRLSYTLVFVAVGLLHPIATTLLVLMIPRLEPVYVGLSESTDPSRTRVIARTQS